MARSKAIEQPGIASQRDHLFISYATEDSTFVDWLSLRLTAEGYLVWRDQEQLKGGEPYPVDIDAAIKDRSFRFLAVLSRNSIEKPNPLRERTLALNLGTRRSEPDFLVPLNLDGLHPTDLGWMLSSSTFISFKPSWAQGLAQLLEKLESVHTPRALDNGRGSISQWLLARDRPVPSPERLWSNLIPIEACPAKLRHVRSLRSPIEEALRGWPHHPTSGRTAYCLLSPPDLRGIEIFEDVDWAQPDAGRPNPLGALHRLLRAHAERYLTSRGLLASPAGRHREYYFPAGLLDDETLRFRSYSGRKSRVKVAGVRSFRRRDTPPERVGYRLAVSLAPALRYFGAMHFALRLSIVLFDAAGSPLDSSKVSRRRRRIARSWWNHQWLTRQIAVVSFLASGTAEITLEASGDEELRMAGSPRTVVAPVRPDVEIEDEVIENEAEKEELELESIETEEDGEDEGEDVDAGQGERP